VPARPIWRTGLGREQEARSAYPPQSSSWHGLRPSLYRTLILQQNCRQVFGADLNCSESRGRSRPAFAPNG
jgi:hypothetical protein